MTKGVDSFVQTPPDGGGKNIATTTVTRDDGSTAQRQETVIGDPMTSDLKANVTVEGALRVAVKQNAEILIQLKRIAMLLQLIADEEVSADEID